MGGKTVDGLGRFYNYLGADDLLACWSAAGNWAGLEIESWQGGGFDNLPTGWIAITAIAGKAG